jgi:hypothetical protein
MKTIEKQENKAYIKEIFRCDKKNASVHTWVMSHTPNRVQWLIQYADFSQEEGVFLGTKENFIKVLEMGV